MLLVAWHLEPESNLGSNLRSAQYNLGQVTVMFLLCPNCKEEKGKGHIELMS